jgi:hypothetical protein
VDSNTAAARYQAALDWFDQYKHLVISDGPFILARYDPPAQFAELRAFRDPAYPFKPGDHYKGRPQLIEFVSTEVGPLVPGGKFEAKVSLSGPGTLAVRYLLLDAATGQVVHQGEATPVTGTDFVVRLDADVTAQLEVGLYQLLLAAYSDELAQITERRLELEAGLLALETPTKELVEETPVAEKPAVVEKPPAVEPTVTPLATEVPVPPPAPKPGTPVGLIIGVVIVIAILGAGAGLWWSRQRRKRE